ncbi:TetR/AcrR family transcriptional regulator [Kitasatospora sp. GP82]|uniref:TetR/AcrR family transcriptional regulator n=1 Tax=Kitasatospora sp. GP82 TaxID=3035089 RepID=UPI00247533BC|nr:TetR/AcrR family transcriptional regulator [Kitasatospora sp. GP82]MDH6124737.1 AcrR family transcriptional regulator [Kitasatospora sp. GP82]
MRRTAAQTREHVLDVAHELFYWQGIRSVGVDRIASEAGVAPTTLYRVFASKDDLVEAYVERAAQRYRTWFDAAVSAGGDDPRDRVLSVFDALPEQLRPEICHGCPFMMALGEFPEPSRGAHRQAAELKQWVHGRFLDLSRALPVADPDLVADQLFLALEGSYATVQALGTDGPARRARTIAELVLAQTPGKPVTSPVGGGRRRTPGTGPD